MQLANGYYQLPAGKIANAVTWLELRDLTRPPEPPPFGFNLQRLAANDGSSHRLIYGEVGVDWLWSGLLQKTPEELAAYLADPSVLSYAVIASGKAVGLLDLEMTPGEGIEVVYFGLVGTHTGRGAGNWLMGEAIRIARESGQQRLWLHTCNFDHPRAVAFYQKQGFRIYAQGFEIMDDPRRKGLLPREAAPHVPFLDGQ
jgi:GNAT superfamily N-acetyltransferase